MIVVIGSGFLGSYVLRYASAHTEEKRIGTVRAHGNIPRIDGVEWVECDVTRQEDLHRLSQRCAGEKLNVFYFAACHNIDFVLEHPQEALKINVDALRDVLDALPNIEKLFFASTDCVYGENDAQHPTFSEDAPCAPKNVYGQQKALAEQIVHEHGFTVTRLPYMFGPSLTQKPHFFDTASEALRSGKPIRMIDGLYRSALSYETAAQILFALSRLPADALPQTVNVCGDCGYSKYELGCLFAQKADAPLSLVEKISEEQGKAFFKDYRAHSAVMDNTRLKRVLGCSSIQVEGIVW